MLKYKLSNILVKRMNKDTIMQDLDGQIAFDKEYVCSNEVGDRLKICRATIVNARRRGDLPPCIYLNNGQLLVWKRKIIEPYLEKYGEKLKLDPRHMAGV